MNYSDFLSGLGFQNDPFAKTNADEEDRLSEYFIAPPFFTAVYGDPHEPKSSVVFAPRGGGKTALKRKIEISSQGKDFLCITYNEFNIAGKTLQQIDLEYHLKNLVELVIVGVLSAAAEHSIDKLNHEDRHFIYLLVREHLGAIDQAQLKQAIKSIKNLSDTATDLWNRFTGPIGLVINSLLERIGLANAEIGKFEKQGGTLGPLLDRLRLLQALSSKLGYRSIYILIDRVDENALTGTADSSYKFIAPLLNDLQVLELPGYGFKFFLWNLLLDNYRTVARPDRVKFYLLEWNYQQLKEMLSQRLNAYSSGKVRSLESISNSGISVGLDETITYFAQGSPRNVVRISKEIFDQQSHINPSVTKISGDAIRKGFEQIADNISHELYSDSIIRDLQKTKRCDFTIRHIYSDIFKISQPSALNKVRAWQDIGAVEQIGTIQESKSARSSNHYGMANLLLAKYIFTQIPIADFITNKIRICNNCAQILLRDWNLRSPQHCHHCQHKID